MIIITLTKWRTPMRRSASEIIRNLEMRIAKLERVGREKSMKLSSREISLVDLANKITVKLQNRVSKQHIEDELHDFFVDHDELFVNWEENAWGNVYDITFDVRDITESQRGNDNIVTVESVVQGRKRMTFQVIGSRSGVEVKESKQGRTAQQSKSFEKDLLLAQLIQKNLRSQNVNITELLRNPELVDLEVFLIGNREMISILENWEKRKLATSLSGEVTKNYGGMPYEEDFDATYLTKKGVKYVYDLLFFREK